MSANEKPNPPFELSAQTAYPYLNVPRSPLDFHISKLDRINKSSILASYLAHPYLDMPEDPGPLTQHEINAIYTFLKDNKVLLRSINYCVRSEPTSLTKKRFIERVAQKHKPFAEAYELAFRLRQEALETAGILTENGVDLLFIKSFKDLPLDSDNFDVLVKKTDLVQARRILEDSGFTELVKIREYEWHGPPHKFLYRRLHNGIALTIHLHTQVAWEGIKFVEESDLWNKHQERRIDGVNLCFPSPEHHLLITIAHAFFENRCLKLSDLVYIVEDLQSGDRMNWNYVADWALSDHWFKPLYAYLRLADHIYESLFENRLIEENVFDLLAKKGKIQGERLAEKQLIHLFEKKRLLPLKIPSTRVVFQFIEKVFESPLESSTEKMTKVLSMSLAYLKRRMPFRRKAPVFLVCFSGQDGTGKTEHAKCLWNRLLKRGIRASYVWSRGTGSSIKPLLPIGRLLMSGSRLADTGKYNSKRKAMLKREPMKTIWAYVMLVDELLQLFLKARIDLMFGRVAICDRHVLDVLVDLKCEFGKNISYAVEKIVTNLAPMPKISFILDTEPKEIMRRKEVGDLNLVKCKRASYLANCARMRSTLIDTGKAFEQNQNEILSLFMRARYLGQDL